MHSGSGGSVNRNGAVSRMEWCNAGSRIGARGLNFRAQVLTYDEICLGSSALRIRDIERAGGTLCSRAFVMEVRDAIRSPNPLRC